MTKDDLNRILDLNQYHSIVIDIRDIDTPGLIRVVMIHQGNHIDNSAKVSIEWMSSSRFHEDPSEPGALKGIGMYSDRGVMGADLEEYLGVPVDQWRDLSSSPFEAQCISEVAYTAENMKHLEELVRTHSLPLPTGVPYRFSNVYWEQISRYGEFRGAYFDDHQDV
jgi:hypothetical protein